jgi:hypothetical protein
MLTIRNIIYMLNVVHGGVNRDVLRESNVSDPTFLTQFFLYQDAGVQSAHDLFNFDRPHDLFNVDRPQFQASRTHTEELIHKLLCDNDVERLFADGLLRLLRNEFKSGKPVFVEVTPEVIRKRYSLT